jgi:hypothetical protein
MRNDSFIKYKRIKDYHKKFNLILKKMTYIIGARCKDGVVLVGDKKVTFSGDIQKDKYEEKIRTTPQFNDVIFSAAGIKELFEEFLLELPRRVLWGHNAIEEQNKTLPISFL